MKEHRSLRQMVTLLAGNFFGAFGSGMLGFAIGLYILHRTGSALGMGVNMMVGPMVAVVLTPVVGYIVDTRSHKAIMISAQIGTSVGLLAFAVAFARWPQAYYAELIVLQIILTVTDRFLSTALSASLVTLFPGDQLQRVNSLNQSVLSTAQLLSPMIGAVVYTFISIGAFALVEIVFELLTLACIVQLRFAPAPATPEASAAVEDDAPVPAANRAPAEKESMLANFRAGLRYLRQNRLVFITCLFGAGVNFLFAAVNLGLPYIQVTVLKMPNTLYGLTDAGFAVGMILGGIALSLITLKQHPAIISFWSIMVLAVILTVVGIPAQMNWLMSANVVFYLLINVSIGLLIVAINTPMNTMMQKIVPPAMQGRVFMINGTLATLLMPFGTLVFGYLFDHTAAWLLFLAAGAGTFLLALGVLLYLTRSSVLADYPVE